MIILIYPQSSGKEVIYASHGAYYLVGAYYRFRVSGNVWSGWYDSSDHSYGCAFSVVSKYVSNDGLGNHDPELERFSDRLLVWLCDTPPTSRIGNYNCHRFFTDWSGTNPRLHEGASQLSPTPCCCPNSRGRATLFHLNEVFFLVLLLHSFFTTTEHSCSTRHPCWFG